MASFILLVLFFLPLLYLLYKSSSSSSRRLPPGSLGIPIIGQSLGLLWAMKANTAEEWLARRVEKYGPVSKLTLFGTPTVFVTGPAANRFVFASDALALNQPKSIQRIMGKRNMLELTGEDHRRVRGAVAQFMRPEMLKKYVGKIDEEVRCHLEVNWTGRQNVKVLPLAKILTFNIICNLMFGIGHGALRETLAKNFMHMIAGMWAVPVNLPFTDFNKSLKASKNARKVLTSITRERRVALKQGQAAFEEDLISYLISLSSEDGAEALTDEEIVDNAIIVMIAGYDTSSVLITFMIRHLANDPNTRAEVVREQEEIAKTKKPEEALTWDDLLKMKYTWRVALEVLRMIPPVFGSFRKVLKDVEFDGYLIPKGWQVFWASNVTQMDANIFQEPSKFDPARFENQSSHPPYCFVAFGAGQRICPGNEFAKVETLVMMHYVVTRFEWKLCCKSDVFARDPMPSPSQGLPIKLEPKVNLSKARS